MSSIFSIRTIYNWKMDRQYRDLTARLFIALIYSLTFLPAVAGANFAAPTCAGVRAEHFSQVFIEDNVPCDTVLKIQNELEAIQSFAGAEPPLTLFVNFKSYQSYSDYGRLIVLNCQQRAWDDVRPQEQNEKIWAHEMGHTIFATWLVRDFAPIHGFRDYLLENTRLIVQAKDPKIDTSRQLKDKWNQSLGKARDLQVPYTELFADLTGALFANDALAMTKAMISPSMPQQARLETNYYAFAGEYDLNSWDTQEVHIFFAPARAFIGKRFLAFPMTNQQKKTVLRKVYTACLIEIKKYWAASGAHPGAAEANRSLIGTLSKMK